MYSTATSDKQFQGKARRRGLQHSSPDSLCQLAALIIAHVARWRPHKSAHRMLLHVLLMSRRTMASSVLKRYSASALASSVLPTPVGPRNMKDAIGR